MVSQGATLHTTLTDHSWPQPHHHLWDHSGASTRPQVVYMLPELLADIAASGHNVVGTCYLQANSFHSALGPDEMRPVGETEVMQGVAAGG